MQSWQAITDIVRSFNEVGKAWHALLAFVGFLAVIVVLAYLGTASVAKVTSAASQFAPHGSTPQAGRTGR